jgi:hypothetical protein
MLIPRQRRTAQPLFLRVIYAIVRKWQSTRKRGSAISEGHGYHICEDIPRITPAYYDCPQRLPLKILSQQAFSITTTISIAIIYHNPSEQPHDAMAHYLRLRPSRSISNATSMPLSPTHTLCGLPKGPYDSSQRRRPSHHRVRNTTRSRWLQNVGRKLK